MKHRFLWIDLETTGLDPAKGRPLEWAAVLCEDVDGDDFAITQAYTSPIHWSQAELARLDAEGLIAANVMAMHHHNGLWAAVESSTIGVVEVDAFLASLAGPTTAQVMLAGSSVHFDLSWIRAWFPGFAARCSHRIFDVRTLMTAVETWVSPVPTWTPRGTHRALADIQSTIADARLARAALRRSSTRALEVEVSDLRDELTSMRVRAEEAEDEAQRAREDEPEPDDRIPVCPKCQQSVHDQQEGKGRDRTYFCTPCQSWISPAWVYPDADGRAPLP